IEGRGRARAFLLDPRSSSNAEGVPMRGAVAVSVAGLALLAATPGAAQHAAGVDYSVDIDQKSVFSTIRERDGQPALWVSLQFQLKRARDGGVVTDVPKEEILVE